MSRWSVSPSGSEGATCSCRLALISGEEVFQMCAQPLGLWGMGGRGGSFAVYLIPYVFQTSTHVSIASPCLRVW